MTDELCRHCGRRRSAHVEERAAKHSDPNGWCRFNAFPEPLGTLVALNETYATRVDRRCPPDTVYFVQNEKIVGALTNTEPSKPVVAGGRITTAQNTVSEQTVTAGGSFPEWHPSHREIL